MEGYEESTYGDAFADVYDEWYRGISDVDVTVAALAAQALEGRPVLELGVGTGRLAVPLAAALTDRRCEVHGIDASAAMLDRLRTNDPAATVVAHLGDMVDGLPDGPFGLVIVAYNTLFNLRSEARQQACLDAIAARMEPRAALVVEAFVPDPGYDARSTVTVRSLSADRVVLSVTVARPDLQSAEGQYVELTEAGGVRLRPWSIRWATPEQLDEMAARVGLRLAERWGSFAATAFDESSDRHVSIYRRP